MGTTHANVTQGISDTKTASGPASQPNNLAAVGIATATNASAASTTSTRRHVMRVSDAVRRASRGGDAVDGSDSAVGDE